MGNKEDKSGGRKTVTVNRRARHDYFIDDTYAAGLVLVGTEVKSLRAGRVNLTGAFAQFDRNNELFLYGAHISPHAEGNRFNVEPLRPRKLLLTRRELDRLAGVVQQKGLTLIPLSIYFERGFAKLELGVGRGKKLYDKREAIADRDREREARREFAGRE
ncbi:MAG: SsrA-binding protein SmpB [Capsulimonadales bacterium]|nr:SsrA-binding protein SmpB [Capsulimonadales bacterium]